MLFRAAVPAMVGRECHQPGFRLRCVCVQDSLWGPGRFTATLTGLDLIRSRTCVGDILEGAARFFLAGSTDDCMYRLLPAHCLPEVARELRLRVPDA